MNETNIQDSLYLCVTAIRCISQHLLSLFTSMDLIELDQMQLLNQNSLNDDVSYSCQCQCIHKGTYLENSDRLEFVSNIISESSSSVDEHLRCSKCYSALNELSFPLESTSHGDYVNVDKQFNLATKYNACVPFSITLKNMSPLFHHEKHKSKFKKHTSTKIEKKDQFTQTENNYLQDESNNIIKISGGAGETEYTIGELSSREKLMLEKMEHLLLQKKDLISGDNKQKQSVSRSKPVINEREIQFESEMGNTDFRDQSPTELMEPLRGKPANLENPSRVEETTLHVHLSKYSLDLSDNGNINIYSKEKSKTNPGNKQINKNELKDSFKSSSRSFNPVLPIRNRDSKKETILENKANNTDDHGVLIKDYKVPQIITSENDKSKKHSENALSVNYIPKQLDNDPVTIIDDRISINYNDNDRKINSRGEILTNVSSASIDNYLAAGEVVNLPLDLANESSMMPRTGSLNKNSTSENYRLVTNDGASLEISGIHHNNEEATMLKIEPTKDTSFPLKEKVLINPNMDGKAYSLQIYQNNEMENRLTEESMKLYSDLNQSLKNLLNFEKKPSEESLNKKHPSLNSDSCLLLSNENISFQSLKHYSDKKIKTSKKESAVKLSNHSDKTRLNENESINSQGLRHYPNKETELKNEEHLRISSSKIAVNKLMEANEDVHSSNLGQYLSKETKTSKRESNQKSVSHQSDSIKLNINEDQYSQKVRNYTSNGMEIIKEDSMNKLDSNPLNLKEDLISQSVIYTPSIPMKILEKESIQKPKSQHLDSTQMHSYDDVNSQGLKPFSSNLMDLTKDESNKKSQSKISDNIQLGLTGGLSSQFGKYITDEVGLMKGPLKNSLSKHSDNIQLHPKEDLDSPSMKHYPSIVMTTSNNESIRKTISQHSGSSYVMELIKDDLFRKSQSKNSDNLMQVLNEEVNSQTLRHYPNNEIEFSKRESAKRSYSNKLDNNKVNQNEDINSLGSARDGMKYLKEELRKKSSSDLQVFGVQDNFSLRTSKNDDKNINMTLDDEFIGDELEKYSENMSLLKESETVPWALNLYTNLDKSFDRLDFGEEMLDYRASFYGNLPEEMRNPDVDIKEYLNIVEENEKFYQLVQEDTTTTDGYMSLRQLSAIKEGMSVESSKDSKLNIPFESRSNHVISDQMFDIGDTNSSPSDKQSGSIKNVEKDEADKSIKNNAVFNSSGFLHDLVNLLDTNRLSKSKEELNLSTHSKNSFNGKHFDNVNSINDIKGLSFEYKDGSIHIEMNLPIDNTDMPSFRKSKLSSTDKPLNDKQTLNGENNQLQRVRHSSKRSESHIPLENLSNQAENQIVDSKVIDGGNEARSFNKIDYETRRSGMEYIYPFLHENEENVKLHTNLQEMQHIGTERNSIQFINNTSLSNEANQISNFSEIVADTNVEMLRKHPFEDWGSIMKKKHHENESFNKKDVDNELSKVSAFTSLKNEKKKQFSNSRTEEDETTLPVENKSCASLDLFQHDNELTKGSEIMEIMKSQQKKCPMNRIEAVFRQKMAKKAKHSENLLDSTISTYVDKIVESKDRESHNCSENDELPSQTTSWTSKRRTMKSPDIFETSENSLSTTFCLPVPSNVRRGKLFRDKTDNSINHRERFVKSDIKNSFYTVDLLLSSSASDSEDQSDVINFKENCNSDKGNRSENDLVSCIIDESVSEKSNNLTKSNSYFLYPGTSYSKGEKDNSMGNDCSNEDSQGNSFYINVTLYNSPSEVKSNSLNHKKTINLQPKEKSGFNEENVQFESKPKERLKTSSKNMNKFQSCKLFNNKFIDNSHYFQSVRDNPFMTSDFKCSTKNNNILIDDDKAGEKGMDISVLFSDCPISDSESNMTISDATSALEPVFLEALLLQEPQSSNSSRRKFGQKYTNGYNNNNRMSLVDGFWLN